jgi:TPR repeat protein
MQLNGIDLGACAALLALTGLVGCGPGAAGEALRPDDPTASEALGETEDCKSVSETAEPFLVDWKPEHRGKLQRAMQNGVAVMAYGCKGIKVLEDCKLKETQQAYTFAQIAKEGPHKVALDRNTDLAAHVPLSAIELSAEVKSGLTLELAYIMVGSRGTIRNEVLRSELTGKCDGASHFVRAVWLGAFSFGNATEGSASAGVKVGSAGGHASDSSKKQVQNRAGDLEACDKSASEKFSDGPPPACEAPVRVELVAITKTAGDAGEQAAPAADTASPEVATGGPAKNPCSAGFVLDPKRMCVKKDAAKAYLCAPGNLGECSAQCDKGSGESCFNAASGQYKKGVHPNHAAAQKAARGFLEKGCSKGHQRSCTSLASQLAFAADGDRPRAKQLFTRACDSGEAMACSALASAFEHGSLGDKPDLLEAVLHLRKACDLGSGSGCSTLARWYIEGKGVAPNPEEGLKALQRGCGAGDVFNCHQLGEHLRKGANRDPKKAESVFRRNCELKKFTESCIAVARMHRTGDGIPKKPDQAKRVLESACNGKRKTAACAELGNMYETGDGVPKDELKAVGFYQDSCTPGADYGRPGCYELAVLFERGGQTVKKDADKAGELYGRACRYSPMGDDAGKANAAKACGKSVDYYQARKDNDNALKNARTGCYRDKDQRLCGVAKKLEPKGPPGPPPGGPPGRPPGPPKGPPPPPPGQPKGPPAPPKGPPPKGP